VRFLTRRVASPELAADLAQDAFVRVLRASPATDVNDARAYLFRTAVNLAIDQGRRERLVPMVSASSIVADESLRHAPSSEQVAMSREELVLLRSALEELPARSREVFVLARIEGLSFVEIGERLGISPKTAFSHMVKALSHVKVRLARGWMGSSSGK
jgi:RNA polymerase sigma factor (sigma-70 family)